MPSNESTLVSLFHSQAARLADGAALRVKEGGAWRDVSWRELAEQVNRFGAALLELGLEHGGRVIVLAENRREWLVADLGLLTAGGVNVPIHATLVATQVEYQVRDSEATIAVVSSEAQLSKLSEALKTCAAVRHVIAMDEITPPAGADWDFHLFDDLVSGAGALDAYATMPQHGLETVTPADLAAIMYTSGTTGEPKGVMLTHANLASNAKACLEVFSIGADDVKLCWLPISHIFARTADFYATMAAGSVLALAESYDRLMDNLQEVRPHLLSAVPHFWENVVRDLQEAGDADDPDALQAKLGGRMRVCVSGGAPLPTHVAEFFVGHGLMMIEGYGLTESSPVISSNRPGATKIGTVGQAVPGIEVRIADDGEVLTRGPHVMRGYWKKPEATAETIKDGWLYTGDIGTIDEDGFLSITGRKKEIIVTAGGKNIAPRYLEELLTHDPLIQQAVVIGDRRKYLTALLVPNFELLAPEAEKLGVTETSPKALAANPTVHAFLEARIAERLEDVSKHEHIGKFTLLARPFTIDAGELTPTLKVRRGKIQEAYAAEIDAMYGG